MKRNPEPKRTSTPFWALRALHDAEHQPGHDQKWGELANETPELARKTLVRAQEMRDSGADPGDAYLQAAADVYTFIERQRIVDHVRNFMLQQDEAEECEECYEHVKSKKLAKRAQPEAPQE